MVYRISIIGSGRVGESVGRGFKQLGHDVIFYDINKRRLDELRNFGYCAIGDVNEAVHSTDISFVCVPTPTIGGEMYYGHVGSATKDVATSLRNKHGYHLVVYKSTLLPTTTRTLSIPLLEHYSEKKIGEDIGVCVNPEFLTTIHRTWTDDPIFSKEFSDEERIVIGGFDERSGNLLEELYCPLGIPIFRRTLDEAEFTKHYANAYLMAKTTIGNQMFLLGPKIGFSPESIQETANIVGMDHRIGRYGSIIGLAVGGDCLPKDIEALTTFLIEMGTPVPLLEAIIQINDKMIKEYGVRE